MFKLTFCDEFCHEVDLVQEGFGHGDRPRNLLLGPDLHLLEKLK